MSPQCSPAVGHPGLVWEAQSRDVHEAGWHSIYLLSFCNKSCWSQCLKLKTNKKTECPFPSSSNTSSIKAFTSVHCNRYQHDPCAKSSQIHPQRWNLFVLCTCISHKELCLFSLELPSRESSLSCYCTCMCTCLHTQIYTSVQFCLANQNFSFCKLRDHYLGCLLPLHSTASLVAQQVRALALININSAS